MIAAPNTRVTLPSFCFVMSAPRAEQIISIFIRRIGCGEEDSCRQSHKCIPRLLRAAFVWCVQRLGARVVLETRGTKYGERGGQHECQNTKQRRSKVVYLCP